MSVQQAELTVLMSCYNASRWLHEAIDSVLAQSFEDFEFIIIDDGSEDETSAIIHDYQSRDKRIILIRKKNTGLTDSLNVGLSKAKGRWIARLDADDLCELTRFEEQIKYMRSHQEISLLGTGILEIDAQGQAIKQHFYPTSHDELIKHLEYRKKFFPHSSICFPTEVARRMGGYNLRMHRAQDQRLYYDLASHGKIACLQKILVRQRKHSNQITYEKNGRRQFYYSTAASVCHFLRKADQKDPLAEASEKEWETFLSWVKIRIHQVKIFEMHRTWFDARDKYFSAKNKYTGFLLFVLHLLCSGHGWKVIRNKLCGVSLPKDLAREWVAKICAE